MSQLLLVRTLAPSSLTSLVFAIFSSIETGSSSPTGDTRRWLFFPNAASKSFQRHPLEKGAHIPRFLPARNQRASNAGGREAIHARECQIPVSCRLGSRLAASLSAFRSNPISPALRESSGAPAILPRSPRSDDRDTAVAAS